MDLCIVMVDWFKNELVYEYSCFQTIEEFALLREECLEGVENDHKSYQCCDEDRCNEHLDPPLPREYINRPTSRDPTNTTPAVGPTSRMGMGLVLEQVWDWDVIKAFHTFQCNKGTSLFMPI